jgi:PAS domain S-box-containing protein
MNMQADPIAGHLSSKKERKLIAEIRALKSRLAHFERNGLEDRAVKDKTENVASYPSENPYPVLRISSDGIILYTNEACASLLTDEHRGVNQTAPQEWWALTKCALSTGTVEGKEVIHAGRAIAFQAVPVMDADYCNLYGVDITEQKKAAKKIHEAKKFYQSILESIVDGVLVTDKDDVIFYVNRGMGTIAGIAPDQIEGAGILVDFSDKTLKFFRPRYLKAKETLQPVYYDTVPVVTPAGRQSYQSGWLIPRIKNDQYDGMVCTVEDITERRRAMEERWKSEQRYRDLFEHSPIPLWEQDYTGVMKHLDDLRQSGVSDFETYFTNYPGELLICADLIKVKDVNNEAVRLFKASSKEELIETIASIFTEETIPVFKKSVLSVAKKIQSFESEVVFHTLKGERLICMLRWSLLGTRAIVSTQDITQRKQASEALRKSELMNRSLLEDSPVCIKVIDLDSKLRYMNTTGSRLLKNSDIKAYYGQTYPPEFFPESTRTLLISHLELAIAGKTSTVESPIQDMEGNELWCHTTFVPVRDDEGRVKHVIGSSIDITERKLAEAALKESEERFRTLADGIFEGVVISEQGRLIDVNQAFTEITGYSREEMIDMPVVDLIVPEHRHLAEQHIKTGFEGKYEVKAIRKDGSIIFVEVQGRSTNYHGKIIRISGIQDITERKRAEEREKQHQAEMVRASHLTAIGEMATGIAHELNQPLCAISVHATACVNTIDSGQSKLEELKTDLQTIATQAQRAGEIIRRMRGFQKKHAPEMTPVDLNELVERSIELLSREISHCNISLDMDLSGTSPLVRGDHLQIEQVVVNIIQNAIDAMCNVPANQRQLVIRTKKQSNNLAEIVVCDNGSGIGSDNSGKIFDSFFTTKESGLGIGLSISRSIVEAHQGRLLAKSNEREGATFTVELPVLR